MICFSLHFLVKSWTYYKYFPYSRYKSCFVLSAVAKLLYQHVVELSNHTFLKILLMSLGVTVSCGSSHGQMFPFAFSIITKLLTQLVGFPTYNIVILQFSLGYCWNWNVEFGLVLMQCNVAFKHILVYI